MPGDALFVTGCTLPDMYMVEPVLDTVACSHKQGVVQQATSINR